jgi:tetratricopeptide (TPR) repeat protein
MPENPRIEELRRRVQLDPASIAFAALAEEFRRMGRHEEAIETCRAGLQRHPAYLSARVTLGRALIEVGDYDAAREELETVLRSAPENLAAIRGLAQIHERQGHSTEMDPHLAAMMNAEVERVAQAAAAKPPPPPVEPPPIVVEPIEPEPLFSEPLGAEPVEPEPEPVVAAIDEPFIVKGGPDPATLATLARLERFLAAIESARHA